MDMYILIIVISTILLYLYYNRKPLAGDPVAEKLMNEQVSARENCDELEEEPVRLSGDVEPNKRCKRLGCAARTALEVYSQVGYLPHSKANELVVSDLVRKIMRGNGVKTFDIARLAPIAVVLCFTPSDSDIMGARLMKTDARRVRLEALDGAAPLR